MHFEDAKNIMAGLVEVVQDGSGQFKTIQKAIEETDHGIILIHPGIYNESLSIDARYHQSGPLVLMKSKESGDVTISGDTNISASHGPSNLYVEMHGLTFNSVVSIADNYGFVLAFNCGFVNLRLNNATVDLEDCTIDRKISPSKYHIGIFADDDANKLGLTQLT